ncbi:hypothetical protein V8G54_031320 [Vigna mungo]|uniref:1-acylglycerol-3-phosphate O-acyltransferase n=1 Tax=Vigna mungo TaxID=3915 RepID=A0AAQ3MYE4_VIGMU
MTAAVVVPLGLLFFSSGLIVNLIQRGSVFHCLLVVYRLIDDNWYYGVLTSGGLMLSGSMLRVCAAGVEEFVPADEPRGGGTAVVGTRVDYRLVQVFTDSETFHLMGKEHALVISNHRSDIDWLVGWVLAQRSGCLGSTLAVMKKSSKFLPVCYVWLDMEAFEPTCIFFLASLIISAFVSMLIYQLSSNVQLGLQQLRDFPLPFWLALFVEGTRFTQAKLLAAQEYAVSAGLPVPRNVLIPRTKGFVSAVNHMRSFVPAIYDVTVAIPKSSPAPTMLRLFRGKSSVVHVHIKRHLMKDLPEENEAVAQWCRDIFVAKDALLDKHIAEDTFSDQELQDTGRPVKSLVVVISWACVVVTGAIKFLQWSSLLSSWKGVAFSAIGLGVVTLLMHILIKFSQAERSTPSKVAPAKSGTGEELEARDNKQD